MVKITPAAGVGNCTRKMSSVTRTLTCLAKAAVTAWNALPLEVQWILVPETAIASSFVHVAVSGAEPGVAYRDK